MARDRNKKRVRDREKARHIHIQEKSVQRMLAVLEKAKIAQLLFLANSCIQLLFCCAFMC